MRYLIISTLFLTACGSGFQAQKDARTISGVDPVFAPYVAEYVAYKGAPIAYDIPIQFADLSGYTVGVCTRWSTGERQIQIDKDFWENYLDEGEKREVIAHELGHCDLNRGHTETVQAGKPVSIMYPYVFGLLPTDIASYMTELFSPASATIGVSLSSEMGCVKDIEVK